MNEENDGKDVKTLRMKEISRNLQRCEKMSTIWQTRDKEKNKEEEMEISEKKRKKMKRNNNENER